MKKKSAVLSKTIFSLQLKKALFLAFKEAKKNQKTTIDTQLLLFCILKLNNSLAVRSLKKALGSNFLFNETQNKLLVNRNNKFQDSSFSNSLSSNEKLISLSPPLKKLVFFLVRSSKTSNISVITTLDILKYLVRNKTIKKILS